MAAHRHGGCVPQHRLAFVALDRDSAAADPSRITQRLEGAGSLHVVAAAVVERRPDGELALASWAPVAAGALGPTEWALLLGCASEPPPGGLSVSFVDELRDVLPPGRHSLAVVFSATDPEAAIEQLRATVPGPVVYGTLADELLHRGTTARAAPDAQRHEPERTSVGSFRDHPGGGR